MGWCPRRIITDLGWVGAKSSKHGEGENLAFEIASSKKERSISILETTSKQRQAFPQSTRATSFMVECKATGLAVYAICVLYCAAFFGVPNSGCFGEMEAAAERTLSSLTRVYLAGFSLLSVRQCPFRLDLQWKMKLISYDKRPSVFFCVHSAGLFFYWSTSPPSPSPFCLSRFTAHTTTIPNCPPGSDVPTAPPT